MGHSDSLEVLIWVIGGYGEWIGSLVGVMKECFNKWYAFSWGDWGSMEV